MILCMLRSVLNKALHFFVAKITTSIIGEIYSLSGKTQRVIGSNPIKSTLIFFVAEITATIVRLNCVYKRRNYMVDVLMVVICIYVIASIVGKHTKK